MNGIRIVLLSLPCVPDQGTVTRGAKQPKILQQTIKIFRKVYVALAAFSFGSDVVLKLPKCPWNAFGMDWEYQSYCD